MATTTSTYALNLGNDPSTTNASTTIKFSKLQFEFTNAAGATSCAFFGLNGNLATSTGACH